MEEELLELMELINALRDEEFRRRMEELRKPLLKNRPMLPDSAGELYEVSARIERMLAVLPDDMDILADGLEETFGLETGAEAGEES